MSRTDKDRPWWVQNFQDGPELYDHDHRSGKCIEESLDYAKWSQHRGRRHSCKKFVRVDFTCFPQKVNGKRELVFSVEVPESRYRYGARYQNIDRNRSCFVHQCDCYYDPADPKEYLHRFYCTERYWTGCGGHYFMRRDDSIYCHCDDFPPVPTCDRTTVGSNKGTRGWRYTWGGVPSAFVTAHFHRPERARERNLNDYAREYNTYGDIEDGDFENRQARNSVRWIYW